MRRLFLDTEFTGLTQDAELLSLALVGDDGHAFYAELTGWNPATVPEWTREHVLPHLFLKEGGAPVPGDATTYVLGERKAVAGALRGWLQALDAADGSFQVWGYCPQYDWVLFCELFGGALHIPKCIHYMPMDIALLFQQKTGSPDAGMEAFAGESVRHLNLRLHNALYDAWLTKACYDKLTQS